MGMIRFGYACINTELPTSSRTCRLASATPEVVIELGRENLRALADIIRWNERHGITVFRISSGIIPLASHPVVRGIPWAEQMADELGAVGDLIAASGARVSMHPGQYTVLNSPRPEVVSASLFELEYHAHLLDALGTGPEAKIVLHLGGVYGDQAASMERFASNFARLSPSVRSRLVLENDEKSYTASSALDLSARIGVPVVFDVFHHQYNPSLEDLSTRQIIQRCGETWQPADGPQKLHYSDPWPGKPAGSHAQTVDLQAFARFYDQIAGLNLDVMLEVKDKQASVLKVMAYLGA